MFDLIARHLGVGFLTAAGIFCGASIVFDRAGSSLTHMTVRDGEIVEVG